MFSELPEMVQDYIIFNHAYLSNVFFLFFVFALSAFYIFYYKKNVEKPTVSFALGISRVVLGVVSVVTLFLTPFMMFMLNPQIEENAIINTYIVIYTSYLGLMVIIIIADFVRYVPAIMLKLGGFKLDDPEVDRAFSNMKKEFNKLPFVRHGR